MIRIVHVRTNPDPGDYQHNKAWRIGTARWHISVPKPGSRVGLSAQAGRHIFAIVRLQSTRPLPCRWGHHSWGDSTLDTRLTHLVRWETRCKRPGCRALLCYSREPFIVNGRQQ